MQTGRPATVCSHGSYLTLGRETNWCVRIDSLFGVFWARRFPRSACLSVKQQTVSLALSLARSKLLSFLPGIL